jgi:hypothetical protein
MNDMSPAGVGWPKWPKWPYRGLDFYREADAPLFSGREEDVRSCAGLVLKFGVKVLLLQGSSGSGKSSFLRAGLIPFLKQTSSTDGRNQLFFFRDEGAVIRCTADPLAEIARSIIAVLEHENPFTAPFDPSNPSLSEAVRSEVRQKAQQFLETSGKRDSAALVEMMTMLAGDLPGRLVIVLDQAEEVLTRSDGTSQSTAVVGGFFRFLEDIYLRNIDVRVIVSLRTEYYGRFRDELRISDDRLSSRPRHGGVEPYLLRPLRNPDGLRRIILEPTLAKQPGGKPVYDFKVQPRLADRVVEDLLQQFPHSSVTPALQVVCASLYSRLTPSKREIVKEDYTGLGGVHGIVQMYLSEGIQAVEPSSSLETENWHLLLVSLVSRQSGGTVLSLIESADELEARANSLKIPGPIKPRLMKLTAGRTPLLRGEPPVNPQYFSLKHDVLAIILSRWDDDHGGAIRARHEERARARRVVWAVVAASIVAIGGVAFVAYDRGKASFEAKRDAVVLKNSYAEHAPFGDFRQSLLVMLANLQTKSTSADRYYEKFLAPGVIHKATVEALRRTLPRAPRFAETYAAVGIDSDSGKLALLEQKPDGSLGLTVLALPTDETTIDWSKAKERIISADRLPEASQVNSFLNATGFLSEIGPAVYVAGKLFFWNEDGVLQERDVVGQLPPEIRKSPGPRAEFVQGALHLSQFNWADRDNKLRMLRLGSEDLKSNPVRAPGPPVTVDFNISEQPWPLLSHAAEAPPYHGNLATKRLQDTESVDGVLVEKEAPNTQGQATSNNKDKAPQKILLQAKVGKTDTSQPIEVPLAVLTRPLEPPAQERRRATFGFGENVNAVIFKMDGPQFYIFDLDGTGNAKTRRRTFKVTAPPGADLEVARASTPFVQSPITLTRVSDGWRAAWLAANGVWSVKTSDATGDVARTSPELPLMSGDPGGMKLQFALKGNFLVLLQQKQWGRPMDIRIWDLRPVWSKRIASIRTQELVKSACEIVLSGNSNGVLSVPDAELFQIDMSRRDPCARYRSGP